MTASSDFREGNLSCVLAADGSAEGLQVVDTGVVEQ